MYKLSWSTGFRRAFKKVTKKNSRLEEKIFLTLEKLLHQPFNPELKTHKLHGKLELGTVKMVNYQDYGPVRLNMIVALFLLLKMNQRLAKILLY